MLAETPLGELLYKKSNPRSVEARLPRAESNIRALQKRPVARNPRQPDDEGQGDEVQSHKSRVPKPDLIQDYISVLADYAGDGTYQPKIKIRFPVVAAQLVRGFKGYRFRITYPGGDARTMDGPPYPDNLNQLIEVPILPVPAGSKILVEAKTLSAVFGESGWTAPLEVTVTKDTTGPALPPSSAPVVTAIVEGVRATFNLPTDTDYSHSELWKGVGDFTIAINPLTDGKLAGIYQGKPGGAGGPGFVEFAYDHSSTDTTLFTHVKVRHIDHSGNASALTSHVAIASNKIVDNNVDVLHVPGKFQPYTTASIPWLLYDDGTPKRPRLSIYHSIGGNTNVIASYLADDSVPQGLKLQNNAGDIIDLGQSGGINIQSSGDILVTYDELLLSSLKGVDHERVASSPGTPIAGYERLYAKTDNNWYTKNPAGTERQFVLYGADLNEAIDDQVNILLAATSPITKNYNDAGNVLTIAHANSGVSAAAYDFASVTVDATGHVTAATDNAGTSFPGSPTTGQAFYRTDLRRWAVYDGTRWLADPERIHYQPRDNTLATDKVTLTGSSHIWYATLPYTGTWYIDKIAWWVQVLTTNSASKYWTLRLAKFSSTYGGTVLLDLDTTAFANDLRRPVVGSVNTTFNATSGNDWSIFIEGQPVDGPGNLEVYGVTLTVQEVLT